MRVGLHGSRPKHVQQNLSNVNVPRRRMRMSLWFSARQLTQSLTHESDYHTMIHTMITSVPNMAACLYQNFLADTKQTGLSPSRNDMLGDQRLNDLRQKIQEEALKSRSTVGAGLPAVQSCRVSHADAWDTHKGHESGRKVQSSRVMLSMATCACACNPGLASVAYLTFPPIRLPSWTLIALAKMQAFVAERIGPSYRICCRMTFMACELY